MKRKKGFTLIELVAVIAVLGIVLTIAIPSITNSLKKSTMKAFKVDARSLLETISNKTFEDYNFDPSLLNADNLATYLKIDNNNYESLNVSIDGEKIIVNLVGKDKWAGFIACGSFDDLKVVENASDCNTDATEPTLTLLGSNPVTLNVGEKYIDAGATATDKVSGDLTSKITTVGYVNPNVAGEYTITYTVKDFSNNQVSVIRRITVIDNGAPVIVFATNGSSAYVKSASTKVYVTDVGALDLNSLKFVWNMSTTTPAESTFINSFTNTSTLSTPGGLNGGFYLWIMAQDLSGNKIITRSNVFNLDNAVPTIATTVNSNINASFSTWDLSGGAYVDANGSLVFPTSGASAVSKYLPVTGTPWIYYVDARANTASPYFTPRGGYLSGSSYYDVTYNPTVSNNTYAGNGAADVLNLNQTTPLSWDGWAGNGPTVEYVRINFSIDNNYSVPTTTYSNFRFISAGNSNYQKIITANISDNFGLKTKKWLSGTKTVSDFVSAGTVFTDTITISTNGTYTIYADDNSGNQTVKVVTISGIDTTAPTVTYGTNGNGSYVKNASTTVTVSDSGTGVNLNSLKYQWTTSTTAPAESSFTTSFTNGSSIPTPSGGTGHHYLWILARDNAYNTRITSSNVFYLDNTAPVITMAGTNPVSTGQGATYTDAGATAYDSIFGNVGVTVSSTVNPSVVGTYYVTYTATDSAGNTATATRTVNVIVTYVTCNASNSAGSTLYYSNQCSVAHKFQTCYCNPGNCAGYCCEARNFFDVYGSYYTGTGYSYESPEGQTICNANCPTACAVYQYATEGQTCQWWYSWYCPVGKTQ